MDAPVVVPPRVVGPLGKSQPPPQRSGPPTFSVKQQQQQQQERLERQEMGHVERISRHEHDLEQQRKMLQEVRSRLAPVREKSAALRVLVADPPEPGGDEVQPPLPPPLHPPPVIEEIVEPEETQVQVEVVAAEHAS